MPATAPDKSTTGHAEAARSDPSHVTVAATKPGGPPPGSTATTLTDQPAEDRSTPDPAVDRLGGRRFRPRRTQLQRSMRPLGVVVRGIRGKDPPQMTLAEDQHADRGRGTRGRRREGGADRDRAGEDPGVAVVEGQGPASSAAPAHGVGPADGLRPPFLLLPVGPRVGRRVLENLRVRAVAIWIWLNGHSWAQRQCTRLGIGYAAMENGFRTCGDPDRLQQICDRLGPGAVKNFFWRWQRRAARRGPRAGPVPGSAHCQRRHCPRTRAHEDQRPGEAGPGRAAHAANLGRKVLIRVGD